MLQELLAPLKELLDIDPNKRSMIFSWIFCGVIVYYLHDRNTELNRKLDEHEKICQDNLVVARTACEEQLKLNRQRSQDQINFFIERSNLERDSIYTYFSNEIRKTNKTISRSINNINSLKNENDN